MKRYTDIVESYLERLDHSSGSVASQRAPLPAYVDGSLGWDDEDAARCAERLDDLCNLVSTQGFTPINTRYFSNMPEPGARIARDAIMHHVIHTGGAFCFLVETDVVLRAVHTQLAGDTDVTRFRKMAIESQTALDSGASFRVYRWRGGFFTGHAELIQVYADARTITDTDVVSWR